MKCKMNCINSMDCGKHKCSKTCGEYHTHKDCRVQVDVVLPCKHFFKKLCFQDVQDLTCTEKVSKIFPKCKHTKKLECSKRIEDVKCSEDVRIKCPGCGRVKVKACCEDLSSMPCELQCGKVLNCTHKCLRKCGEDCSDCVVCLEHLKKRIKEAREDTTKNIKKIKDEMRRSKDKQAFSIEVKDQSEFDSVKGLVLNFIVPDHNWFPVITRIERVTNPKLELAFNQAKLELFDPTRPEDRKFHGTGDEGVKNICFGDGFRLPEASRNNMFGQGVYFSSISSKSARELYTKNSNKLLLCKVLLGKSMTAKRAMNELTPASMKKLGYDSLYAPAGNLVKNDEFVVYNPKQALPAYIIHFVKHAYQVQTKLPALGSGFKKTKRMPKRTMEMSDPYDVHYSIAESRFYRLQTAKQMKIVSIDIIENPALEAKFNAKQAEFKSKGIPSDPIFAFHGTAAQNIDSILSNNFSLDRVKVYAYGFGIYLSEQPEVSQGYSADCKSFILCKVLTGNPGQNCTVRQDKFPSEK